MQNPFSTTYSKIPDRTYISTSELQEIKENFSYDQPSESVYKITGLRGSGKTVLLSIIQNEFQQEEYRRQGWLVYNLNPMRDMLQQTLAALSQEDFIKIPDKNKSVNFSAQVLGAGGGIGFGREKDDHYYDIGIALKQMLELLRKKNKRLMICVDEVSKSPEMMVFAMEFGGWLMSGYPVYFICTGLFENIQELGNVKNLTFFRRGRSVETQPLHPVKMAEMYQSKLGITVEEARKMADMTRGYAYAFQMLGSLYFAKGSKKSLQEIEEELKTDLFSYSYEKVWEELSREDRYLASLLTDQEENKREDILKKMGNKAKNYSVYRDRLLKRGVIRARQGYISLNPPYFGEYIKKYGIAYL